MRRILLPLLSLALASCSCGERRAPADADLADVGVTVDLKHEGLYNRAAFVPPQCYTKTQDEEGKAHNPCYVCHQASMEPNYIDDADLQLEFTFSQTSGVNRWTNLFVDRRQAMEAISDEAILAWVRTSNYLAADGTPILAQKLADPPPAWDYDGDGRWGGWIPDVGFRFDERGFDHDVQGEPTGWRAFAYYPFPGTFWPTNGSFGDVLIRLPESYRQNTAGVYDQAIYELNLAIAESLAARRDVPIATTDERDHGWDLDGDGELGEATVVRFRHTPGAPEMNYVGKAAEVALADRFRIAPGLLPEGTELAHTVRYLDVEEGRPKMAARLKELRYMRKAGWMSYGRLHEQAQIEAREKEYSPEVVRRFGGSSEYGIGNKAGWVLQGFIEDRAGDLRPQSREEHAFCIGCHSGLGATIDSTFSFVRKLPADAFRGGWYHWSQRGLEGVPEPLRGDGQGEYSHYLEHNGAGDEFRGNREVLSRFFDRDGSLKPAARALLARDVESLLLPSPARALALNKAYRLVVEEQSFIKGRDAVLEPAVNVHRELPGGDEAIATGIGAPLLGPWHGRPSTPPTLVAE